MKYENMIFKVVALLIMIPTVFFTSCDPSVEYVYTIKNSTKGTLQLKFDYSYYNIYINSKTAAATKNNVPAHDFAELPSGDEAKFSVQLICTAYVDDDPEESGFPLWLPECAPKVIRLNGKAIDDGFIKNKDNWRRVRKSKRYLEYALEFTENDIVYIDD